MRFLIIGGTRFVGRHIAESALERGHEVTVFHRGQTGADALPDATHLSATGTMRTGPPGRRNVGRHSRRLRVRSPPGG